MRSGSKIIGYAAGAALALATAGSASALGVGGVHLAGVNASGINPSIAAIGSGAPTGGLPTRPNGHVKAPNLPVSLSGGFPPSVVAPLPSTPSGVAGHQTPHLGGGGVPSKYAAKIPGGGGGSLAGHDLPRIALGGNPPAVPLPSTPSGVAGHSTPNTSHGGGVPSKYATKIPGKVQTLR